MLDFIFRKNYKEKDCYITKMMQYGPWDILKLNFNTLDIMLRKGYITTHEARDVLKRSMGDNVSESEKNRIADSMIITK